MNKLDRYLFPISAIIMLLNACSEPQKTGSFELADQARVDPKSATEKIINEETKRDIPESLICIDTIIGEGTMIRKKNTLDIDNIFGFLCQPTVGERVIIVPEDPILQAFDLEVIKTVPRDDTNPGEIEWFEVYLQRLGFTEFSPISKYKQETEYPGDVAVIYPYLAYAKSIDKDSLNENDMPENVKIRDVKIAIDWNKDHKPDAIISAFCCNENDDPDECDYTCGETYMKKGVKWVLVHESNPA